MTTIIKKYKNDYHGVTIQDRDLQTPLNTTKFGSIFNLNMLVAILSAILVTENSYHGSTIQDRLATKTLEKDNQGIFSGKLGFGHSFSCQALKNKMEIFS